MAHTCHATDCPRVIPPDMFMCRFHWFSLPKDMRDRIWETYRDGQEDDKKPSHAYCLAAIDCITFIAARERVQPDIRIYEVFDPGV